MLTALATVTATSLTSAAFVAVKASLTALATVTATSLTSAVFVAVGIADGACDGDGNVLDECGVCGGEGTLTALDCDGNVLDECGVCGGEGIADGVAIRRQRP